ncbi:MAG: transcription elongation factor GreA [Candidatus Omnitrophica bacterium]|nr:transcription elongation factor GreA [Candidatus Omnitrophota bacterium]
MSEKVFLTSEGYEKLKAELKHLKETKRMEVARQLETARAHGDLSENAEYDTAKEAKAQLESRIRTLEEKLMSAKVVDLSEIKTDKIYFGTSAELKNLKTGATITFSFVAQDEADLAKNRISIQSPIGKALLGHAVGDKVNVTIPAGVISFQVLKIERAS